MKNRSKSAPLRFTHAIAWIVASIFVINGTGYAWIKHYFKQKHSSQHNPNLVIRSIIQTGPQKEALKTEYLAELLKISSTRPPIVHAFPLDLAKKRLLSSPLISRADVKIIEPDTLYIDYTVRQPIAWVEDFENIVLDKEGYLFPFSPFFSPKNLPALYFGLSPFGQASSDPERPVAKWNTPLDGKFFHLAISILNLVTDPTVADQFNVKRIDVSNAFAESYGTREVVLITEDVIYRNVGTKYMQIRLPRVLRLSTKNYHQELGNYLKLREQLLEEEQKNTHLSDNSETIIRRKEKIIDFRIQKLAFIEEKL